MGQFFFWGVRFTLYPPLLASDSDVYVMSFFRAAGAFPSFATVRFLETRLPPRHLLTSLPSCVELGQVSWSPAVEFPTYHQRLT